MLHLRVTKTRDKTPVLRTPVINYNLTGSLYTVDLLTLIHGNKCSMMKPRAALKTCTTLFHRASLPAHFWWHQNRVWTKACVRARACVYRRRVFALTVSLPVDGALVEAHDVLCKSSCLVTEYIFYLKVIHVTKNTRRRHNIYQTERMQYNSCGDIDRYAWRYWQLRNDIIIIHQIIYIYLMSSFKSQSPPDPAPRSEWWSWPRRRCYTGNRTSAGPS